MKRVMSGIIVLIIGLASAYFFYNGSIGLGIGFLVAFVFVGLYLLGISEEKKEAAGENALNIDKDRSYGYVSGDSNLDVEFENAKKIREELLKNTTPDDESLEINAAAGLMLDKDFIGSIKAYEKIIEKYPHRKGECIGQIGVGEFFLGNYEKALEKYIESKNADEDTEITEDNIWEVCELMNKKGIPGQIEKYISLYPQGRYLKKANKLLA
jgi:tetratricopeptide (TPR) repeat protein